MIYCFSGTGNSAYVARKLSAAIGEPVQSVNQAIKMKQKGHSEEGERLVFVMPTYCYQMPRVVESWIRKSDFSRGARAYFVLTCGMSTGNAVAGVRKLCRDKGFLLGGFAAVIMPENYLAMFQVPREQKAKEIIRRAEPVIHGIGACIRDGLDLPVTKCGPVSKVITGTNPMFYSLVVHSRKFRVTQDCISCGKCEDVCPLNNITMLGEHPSWGQKCTHCMACITSCPTEAIEYGKKTKGKPRYRCPM